MLATRFQERLLQEWEMRRRKNSRYSRRAFATFLGTDNSTLSQILRGARRTPISNVRTWARKLGMEAWEAEVYVAAEHTPDLQTLGRHEQLRHWTAEAMAIVSQPVHWHIVRLSRMPEFQPNCRWIAGQIGVGVDDVNLAFTRLLRLRLLEVRTPGQWRDLMGMRKMTEREFRRLALSRIREKAAETGPGKQFVVGS
jgi:transcriptional regulator with XRE-family HTH domain